MPDPDPRLPLNRHERAEKLRELAAEARRAAYRHYRRGDREACLSAHELADEFALAALRALETAEAADG